MYFQLESLVVTGIGVGAGLYWFVTGFKELKSSRTVQNIPTSRIATGAVGTNVEIQGKIVCEPEQEVVSPLTGQSCVFYSVEIEQRVRNRNRDYWKTIDRFYSHDGFYVDDGSGARALVRVDGAQIKRQGRVERFRWSSHNLSEMHPRLKQVLETHREKLKRFKLEETSWLFSKKYRFSEWVFAPGESVYVLGFADSGLQAPKKRKLKFKNFLRAKKMIQENEDLGSRFDADQNGVLDEQELERGAQRLGMKLQGEAAPDKKESPSSRAKMIFRKREPYPFLISNMREKDLIRKLSGWATLKVWGGPAVTIGSVAYLFTLMRSPFE